MVCSPDELPAVAAEGGLAQEGGHELVSVDLVHAAAHGPPAAREAGPLLELAARRAAARHRAARRLHARCNTYIYVQQRDQQRL